MTNLAISFGLWVSIAVALTAFHRISFDSKFEGISIILMSFAWGVVATLFAAIILV